MRYFLVSAAMMFAAVAWAAWPGATLSGPAHRVRFIGAVAVAPPVEQPAPAPRQYRLTASGSELVLADESGRAVLRLPAQPHLDFAHGAEDLQGHWTKTAAGFVARAQGEAADTTIEVTASAQDPFVRLSVERTYKQDVLVSEETLSVALGPGVSGTLMDRAYQMQRIGKRTKLFVDRWTPRVGQWASSSGPAFALMGDDSMQGLWVSNSALVFELDHRLNHEHSVHTDCFDTYERHRPRRDASMTARRKGDVVQQHVVFVAGRAQAPVLRRWPDGARAAFAIVDHADGANSKNLRALMYGSSRRHRPPRGKNEPQGLVGHRLPITKTVFSTPYQLKNPYFRKLAKKLEQAGSEIAPHSITPLKDTAETIVRELDGTFAEFAPRTWVDHQPDTNCEALNNHGGEPGHKENVVATLMQKGLRYFWEAPDFRGWRGLNLWRPHKRSERVSFFYPGMSLDSGPDAPWLFRSAWLFLPRETVTARLQPKKLNALEWAHGLFIAHTYFGATKTAKDPAGRSVFEELDDGTLRLRPAFDAVFGDLARRHRKGTMFVATMGELGQWLEAWSSARLVVQGPREVKLVMSGQGAAPARRFTVRKPGKRDVNVTAGETVALKTPLYEIDLGVTAH